MMRPGSTRSPAARGAALQRGSALRPPPAGRAVRIGGSSSSSSRVCGVRAAAAGAASGDAPSSKETEGRAFGRQASSSVTVTVTVTVGAPSSKETEGPAVGRQETEALSELRQLRAAVAELRAGQDTLLQELAAQRAAAAKEARTARLQRAQAQLSSRLPPGSRRNAVAHAVEQLLCGRTEFRAARSGCSVAYTQAELEALTGLRFRVERRPAADVGEQGCTCGPEDDMLPPEARSEPWLILVDDASS